MRCFGRGQRIDYDALWKRLEEDPAFFDVRIARDGGFSEIPNLFTNMRWVTCVVAIAFIAMNIWAILAPCIRSLRNDSLFVDASMAKADFLILCKCNKFISDSIGYDAFLLKLWYVADSISKAEDNDAGHYRILVTGLAFLNQMLGVVQVSLHVRSRIFEFIFGGEDCAVSEVELAIWRTWEAMLAQKTFEILPLHQAIMVLFTFSDADFQRLALNEAQTGIKARQSQLSLRLTRSQEPGRPDRE